MKDALIRAARTYAQTFVGLLLVGWSDWTEVGEFLDLASSAAVAAVPAALALIHNALENTTAVSTGPKG